MYIYKGEHFSLIKEMVPRYSVLFIFFPINEYVLITCEKTMYLWLKGYKGYTNIAQIITKTDVLRLNRCPFQMPVKENLFFSCGSCDRSYFCGT